MDNNQNGSLGTNGDDTYEQIGAVAKDNSMIGTDYKKHQNGKEIAYKKRVCHNFL